MYPYIDFIDDTTIAAFTVGNAQFKILFYNIQSQKEQSLGLFDYKQDEKVLCNINKNNRTAAVYNTKSKNLYVVNDINMKNQKMNTPFAPKDHFASSAIKFSTDGSKIIGTYFLGEGQYDKIFDIQKHELSSEIFESNIDVFNNIKIINEKNSISLKVVRPSLAQGIAKHLPFKANLSGLSGEFVTSLQFSKDGNSVIGCSGSRMGNNNNLIVWPLVTKEEVKGLEKIKKLPISTAKLLLPLSISSLQGKTTAISLEDWQKINNILLPQSISNLLLIQPTDKPLSSLPKILATE